MRGVLAALSLATCLLLAGCTGGAKPAVSPVPSSTGVSTAAASGSTAPSVSPTATTPLLTGAAVRPGEVPPTQDPRFITDDQAGAISFAAYFYRALDWSIATTNPNLLRPISDPGCATCQHYIQELDQLSADRGHIEGGRISVNKYAPAHGDVVQSDFVVQVTADQQAVVVVTSAGDRTTQSAAASGLNYLYTSWRNGAFIAIEIGRG